MALKLYNALSRQKEEFKPINPGKVGMYVCGPTVYGYCHLGHGRGYVSMDILRRYLEYRGYEVRHIMNYTDVGHLVGNGEEGEDKIEKEAKKEKIDPLKIADKYIQSCEEDFSALNIKPAHFTPRPTRYVAQIIKFVGGLIQKGFAYEVNGSVYFSVEKFPEYGKLSGRKTEELLQGARVEINPEKKNPLDFALWIKAPEGHILKWESPWGIGYPGWHIECSAMSYDLLGQSTFDIHGGGNENIFPHNENEIAQSETYMGERMANFWTLWNMVQIDGVKMSKSLGNFTSIKDALKKYDSMAIRLWILSSHYRSPINFSEKSLAQAQSNWQRIKKFISDIKKISNESTSSNIEENFTQKYQENFEEAMDDDLNTPLALSVLYDLLTQTNKLISENKLDSAQAKKIISLWEKMNRVFGFIIAEKPEEIPAEILNLLEERKKSREEKDYAKSDELRKKIESLGYNLEDTKEGQKVYKK